MSISLIELFQGIVISFIIAFLAYRKQSLSQSGLYAATVLGTLIFSLGGLVYWLIMITFFISSSLLSKIKNKNKSSVEGDFAKTGRRDWLQVAANGSMALAFATLWHITADGIFTIGYVATFATVNADTWATEIGVLSPQKPVSILNLKPVETGASGAISGLGTTAALLGAVFITLVSGFSFGVQQAPIAIMALSIAAISGGFVGAMTDSLLGATLQAMYRCSNCHKLTEKKVHCQGPTTLTRGLECFQNDTVNFVSSLIGALTAMALYTYLT